MDRRALMHLLNEVAGGVLSVDAAVARLNGLPFSDLGFARVDHHRALRQGVPEVVFGLGKTAEEVLAVARNIVERGQTLLVTRVEADQAPGLLATFPGAVYNSRAGTFCLPVAGQASLPGRVLVVTAGTSDLPVAEEAMETLRACGVQHEQLVDVGVAGIHRLLAEVQRLASADVLIVVAGMEGALPSVVGGLVASPVIAVPTSVGYGAALGGFTALASMLTSCASGVTVVNIDNGFGAAFAAVRILRSACNAGRVSRQAEALP